MRGKWKNLEGLIDYSGGGIISKAIFRTKTIDATLFCMAKGTEMSEHTSTKEGIVSVIEGNGSFFLKGKKIPMLPGTIVHLAKNAKHSLKATEDLAILLCLTK